MKVSLFKNGKKIKTINASIGANGTLLDKARRPIMIQGKEVSLGETVGDVSVVPEGQDAPSFAHREKMYKGEISFYYGRYGLRMLGHKPVQRGDWKVVKPYAFFISEEMAHDGEDYDFNPADAAWYFQPAAVDALIESGYSVSFKNVQIESSKDLPARE